MNKNVIDFNKYKLEKYNNMVDDKNTELFKEVISKNIMELSKDEEDIYREFEVKYSTLVLNEEFNVVIMEFRGVDYVVNCLNTSFEYLGKFEDILLNGIY